MDEKYLHLDGVITITNMSVADFEKKFYEFLEENKCSYGGGSWEEDSEGNEGTEELSEGVPGSLYFSQGSLQCVS